MYEARKICNFLLANFDAIEFDLTNLRINKLLFFIQASALRQIPEGLIRNHFEAWQYGPVIKPVFDAFKIHRDGPITAPTQYLDYSSGKYVPVPFDDIQDNHLKIVVSEFRAYSYFTLANWFRCLTKLTDVGYSVSGASRGLDAELAYLKRANKSAFCWGEEIYSSSLTVLLRYIVCEG